MSNLVPSLSNTTGLAQTTEAATHTIQTDVSNGIIAPFIADLFADASGTVGTLQQVTVSMTNIDQVFDVVLSDADAVKILNAFRIQDVSGANFTSVAAEVNVTMKSDVSDNAAVVAFKEALTAALVDTTADSRYESGPAVGAAGAQYRSPVGSDIKTYLKNESAKDTVDILGYDTLATLLEASDLLTFDIAVDASGGAANMYTKMSASTSTAAKYRKAIFAQIPKSNIDAYLTPSDASGNSHLDTVSKLEFLPLLKGDKMTFVFDVTVGEYGWDNEAPVSGAAIKSVVNDAAAVVLSESSSSTNAATTSTTQTNVTSSNYAGPDTDLVFTTPTVRRIAVTLKMGSGSGVFTTGASTVAEMETAVLSA